MNFVHPYRSDIDKELKYIGCLAPYMTLACRGQHCRLKDSFQMNHSPISSTSNKTSDIDSHDSTRPNHEKKSTQVKNCQGISWSEVLSCAIRRPNQTRAECLLVEVAGVRRSSSLLNSPISWKLSKYIFLIFLNSRLKLNSGPNICCWKVVVCLVTASLCL